ncbi:MAG: alpha/beta hydrolase [Chloroflexi bacterium]|nr:alpha/beta hydrolase [Chloroflexota bacterium]
MKPLPARGLSLVAVALALLLAGCSSGPKGEQVSFATEDRVQLSGHVFGTGDVGVVLSHMRPADQRSWWPFAEVLANRGYRALAFDFRGYGDSQGQKQMEYLDVDVQAALHFLQGQGVPRVFLVGASMGGTASVKVAAREDVAGIVTLSAPAQTSDGLNVELDVAEVAAPKLFIVARDDEYYAGSVDLFMQESQEPKEAQRVEGRAHGTDLLGGNTGDRVQGLILDFLQRHQ